MWKKRIFLIIIFLIVTTLLTIKFGIKEQKKQYKLIAIATLMSHPALDAVIQNLKKELATQGFAENKNIKYIIRNANGQIQLVANIANELSALNPDVIVAVTTPMAQAIVKVARCPVVFAAVTDPVGAGLVKSLDKCENMITGTSDAWPYYDQLKLIKEITPKVNVLGVLYNPGEAASQYGIKKIRYYAPKLGLKLIEGAVSTTTEMYPVAQNLASRVDALFLSSDNTVISGVGAALKVAIEHKIPLYVGDSGTVAKGGLAAVSVGYPELGRETGKLVARVLRGERCIPVVVARGSEIYLNLKAAELMGVSIPEKIIKKAKKIYYEIQK